MSDQTKQSETSISSVSNTSTNTSTPNDPETNQPASASSTSSPPSTASSAGPITLPASRKLKLQQMLWHCLMEAKGEIVSVTKTNGDTFSGVLFAIEPADNALSDDTSDQTNCNAPWKNIVLKYAQKMKDPNANPADRIRARYINEIRIPAADFACLSAIHINDHSNCYRRSDRQAFNDASGRRMHRKSRDLVAWQATGSDEEMGALENENDLGALDEDYDQFKANAIDAEYDESLYTSELNKHSDEYQKSIKEAEMAEAQIMNQPTQSKHVLDDRAYYLKNKNKKKIDRNAMDEDEEDAYSRVIHEDNRHTTKNKNHSYQPPHLRNSTNAQMANKRKNVNQNQHQNKRPKMNENQNQNFQNNNNNFNRNNNNNNNRRNNMMSQDMRNQPNMNQQNHNQHNMNHSNSPNQAQNFSPNQTQQQQQQNEQQRLQQPQLLMQHQMAAMAGMTGMTGLPLHIAQIVQNTQIPNVQHQQHQLMQMQQILQQNNQNQNLSRQNVEASSPNQANNNKKAANNQQTLKSPQSQQSEGDANTTTKLQDSASLNPQAMEFSPGSAKLSSQPAQMQTNIQSTPQMLQTQQIGAGQYNFNPATGQYVLNPFAAQPDANQLLLQQQQAQNAYLQQLAIQQQIAQQQMQNGTNPNLQQQQQMLMQQQLQAQAQAQAAGLSLGAPVFTPSTLLQQQQQQNMVMQQQQLAALQAQQQAQAQNQPFLQQLQQGQPQQQFGIQPQFVQSPQQQHHQQQQQGFFMQNM